MNDLLLVHVMNRKHDLHNDFHHLIFVHVQSVVLVLFHHCI
jgi:hypothetical protein